MTTLKLHTPIDLHAPERLSVSVRVLPRCSKAIVALPMLDREPPCLCSVLAGRIMACKPLPLRRRIACDESPDERLNADLKYALGSTVAMRNKSALWHATVEYMTMLEQSPERVMSYFQDPRVQYAA